MRDSPASCEGYVTDDTTLEPLYGRIRARLTQLLTPDGSPGPLRRWLIDRTWPRMWVALRDADNEPRRFLAGPAGALRPLVVVVKPTMAAVDEGAFKRIRIR